MTTRKPAHAEPAVSALVAADPPPPIASPTVTWGDVATRLGAPTDAERAMYEARVSPDDRVAMGRRLASSKILTDLLRWMGDIAAWQSRTPEAARKKLVGYSDGHVRVAFAEGEALRALVDRYEAGEGAAAVTQGGADAHVASTATTVRHDYDALYNAVADATLGDARLRGKVEAAWSKATRPKPLAAAVKLLADVASEILGKKGSPIAARLAHETVTPELVAGLVASAKALGVASERAAGPRAAGAVTERDLDLQDGTCLAHMTWLYGFFGALHAKDPGAPHLVSIATRSFFVGHAHAKPAAAPSGEGGAAPNPS